MNRIITAILSLILVVSPAALAVAAAPAKPPNIVIIMPYELGWSEAGYRGNTVVKTPNLDDMAGKGLQFDYFYPGCPIQFAIMSGRNSARNQFQPEEMLLPHALKQVGYTSAHFGLWRLGRKDKSSPVNRGFDQAVWTPKEYGIDVKLQVNDTPTVVETKGDSSVAIMDQALEYIRKQAKTSQPFLAQVFFAMPHSGDFPNAAEAKFKDLYQGINQADKLGTISGLDAAVGNLRAELRKLGIADNTIVWFVGSRGGDGGGNDPSGLGKWSVGHRVQGLLEWPARIKTSIKTNLVCGHIDMFPTLLEIAGVPVNKQSVVEGVSLVPLIDGKMTERPKPIGFVDWGTNGPAPTKAAELGQADRGQGVWIDGKYKLMLGNGPINKARRNVSLILCDIYADPAFRTNLADKEPERVMKMTQAFDDWLTSVRASYDGGDYRGSSPAQPAAQKPAPQQIAPGPAAVQMQQTPAPAAPRPAVVEPPMQAKPTLQPAASSRPAVGGTPLKVFVLIGTSNMMGFGANVGQLPQELRQPQKDVFVYQDGAWETMKPGQWHQAGPEHSFAQAMVKYFGEPVGIIKIVAGKNIRKGDTKGYDQTLAMGWSPENVGGVYGQFVELVKEAGKDQPIVLSGIVLDESGRDTVKQETAAAYQKNLTHLIECMRRDFGNPALPFVCAMDNTHPGNPTKFPYMDVIRKAQTAIALPGYRTFDQNDLPRVMDTAKEEDKQGQHNDHFTTAGEVESGERYAAAMVDILNQAKGLQAAKATPVSAKTPGAK